jgi:hypothetical protein
MLLRHACIVEIETDKERRKERDIQSRDPSGLHASARGLAAHSESPFIVTAPVYNAFDLCDCKPLFFGHLDDGGQRVIARWPSITQDGARGHF